MRAWTGARLSQRKCMVFDECLHLLAAACRCSLLGSMQSSLCSAQAVQHAGEHAAARAADERERCQSLRGREHCIPDGQTGVGHRNTGPLPNANTH
jgi:hypothetical protein